jgi:hypothetical protein
MTHSPATSHPKEKIEFWKDSSPSMESVACMQDVTKLVSNPQLLINHCEVIV